MILLRRIPARAGESLPAGSYVKIVDGDAFVDPALDGDGVVVGAGAHEAGAAVDVQTDGEIMASIEGLPLWVKLQDGKIIG
jgi:hypothetical protein